MDENKSLTSSAVHLDTFFSLLCSCTRWIKGVGALYWTSATCFSPFCGIPIYPVFCFEKVFLLLVCTLFLHAQIVALISVSFSYFLVLCILFVTFFHWGTPNFETYVQLLTVSLFCPLKSKCLVHYLAFCSVICMFVSCVLPIVMWFLVKKWRSKARNVCFKIRETIGMTGNSTTTTMSQRSCNRKTTRVFCITITRVFCITIPGCEKAVQSLV